MLFVKVLNIVLFLFYVNAKKNVITRSRRQVPQYNGDWKGLLTDNAGQIQNKLLSQFNKLGQSRPVDQSAITDNFKLMPKLEPNVPMVDNIEQQKEFSAISPHEAGAFTNNEPSVNSTWPVNNLQNSETMLINKIIPKLEINNNPIDDEQARARLELNQLQSSVTPKLYEERESTELSTPRSDLLINQNEVVSIVTNPDEIQDVTKPLSNDEKLKINPLGSPISNDNPLANAENIYYSGQPLLTTPSTYSTYYGNNIAYQARPERFRSISTTLRPPYKKPMSVMPITIRPPTANGYMLQPIQPAYISRSQLRQISPEPFENPEPLVNPELSFNPEPSLDPIGSLNLEPSVIPTLPSPYNQVCLQEYGYYRIENNCDSYIECKAKQGVNKTCPEGLHFNPKMEYPNFPCSYPSEVQCDVNARIEPALPTKECPHQFGFFHSSDGDCNKYIVCEHGKAINMSCSSGLVFNIETATCDWPDNVPSCKPTIFKGFKCPQLPEGENNFYGDTVTKYRYGNSCRKFIACQKGIPRLLSCDPGLAYDEQLEKCVFAEYVVNCAKEIID
ncbi:hypothetical protein ACJJTC_010071 [Scirpophaga incertulas]